MDINNETNDYKYNLYLKIFNNKLLKKDINKYVKLNCDWRIKRISKEDLNNIKLNNDSTYKYIIVQDLNSIEDYNKFINLLDSTITCNINNDGGKINSGSNNMIGISFNRCKISVKLSKLYLPSTIRILDFNDGLSLELDEGIPLVNSFLKLLGNKNTIKSAPIFENLTSLDLGIYNQHVLQGGYLENAKNLNTLTFSHIFSAPISQRMLPNQIETLIFKCGYNFNEIYFPSSLKELQFIGKPNYVVGHNFKVLDYVPPSLTSIILEYCDTMIFLSDRKLINQLKKVSIIHNKIYLSTFNILLNSLYQNNNNYFQDQRILGIKNTLENTSHQTMPPPHITQSERLKIPKPILESLSMKFYDGPLQLVNPDLFPCSLKELSLPVNLLVWVTNEVKRGYPGSITSFEGTLSHLSAKFENPQNIDSLSVIITSEYTANNTNTPYRNKFNSEYHSKNNIDFSILNINNNNQLLNQFQNLNSLKLYFQDTSIISSIPTNIENLEIHQFNLLDPLQNNNPPQFNLNLLDFVNLKSLRLDTQFTFLLIQKLNSTSTSTLITQSPFPTTLILLDLSFGPTSSLLDITLNQSFFNSIKFLIIRGNSNQNISSLPQFLELIFIEDTNTILNNNKFLSIYSSIIRTFNKLDENIIYNNLKNTINNIYIA